MTLLVVGRDRWDRRNYFAARPAAEADALAAIAPYLQH